MDYGQGWGCLILLLWCAIRKGGCDSVIVPNVLLQMHISFYEHQAQISELFFCYLEKYLILKRIKSHQMHFKGIFGVGGGGELGQNVCGVENVELISD